MDRFGLFVDAGYLYAAASQLVLGDKKRRDELSVDVKQLAGALASRAAENCDLSHLRTYWYDAARDARPNAAQLEVASLPGVKLRLGRLVGGGQKGVDSRIVRDLIILAQEKAISVAYLLGADEDLREGVMEAQERGVRVVLMAIEPLQRNLSQTLSMEADDVIALDRTFLEPVIALRPEASLVKTVGAIEPIASATPDALSIGRSFGVSYRESHPDQLAGLRQDRPRIPSTVDKPLLEYAVAQLGRPHLEDHEREGVRAGFWQAILLEKVPSPEIGE